MFKKRLIVVCLLIIIIILSVIGVSKATVVRQKSPLYHDKTSMLNKSNYSKKMSPFHFERLSHSKQTQWSEKFITHVALEDKNGYSKNNFGIYDNLQAHWHLKISAKTPIKSGDTMVVKIPSALCLATDLLFDIRDADNQVIGHAIAKHRSAIIMITMTKYAEKQAKNGISGQFKVWVHWNQSQVENHEKVTVDWGKHGTTLININPGPNQPSPDEMLYKWGWNDENDPSIIHWRVRINYRQSAINQVTYRDSIGVNQKLISGSIDAYHIKFNDNHEQHFEVTNFISKSHVHEENTHQFHIYFDHLDDIVYVDYATQSTDKGQSTKYENSGQLVGANIEKQTIDVYSPENGGYGQGETMGESPKVRRHFSGTVIWRDNHNKANKRPSESTVNLLANGQVTSKQTVTKRGGWQYIFLNLPQYDKHGEKIVYTITETHIKDYRAKIKGGKLINTADCKIKPNTLHKKTAETLMVID